MQTLDHSVKMQGCVSGLGSDTEQLSDTCPLWDFRNGDADDNRASPHGRGWRSLIASVVLELNYVTASVTFVLLVVAPALAIGLLPPLVATYGQRVAVMSAARLHPIRTALGIAVVVVLLTIARPLIARTVDAFWNVKYTLIFPIVIAVRELVCAVLERTPTRVTSARQFARRRRVGTVIAALLFIVGGVLLAWTVEFSSGSRLVAVANVRFWIIAQAALRNAVVILGISTALVSTNWLWAEITTFQEAVPWRPAERPSRKRALRVAHLSDLHLVSGSYDFRMESGTSGPRGNGRACRAFQQLAAAHARKPFDHVFVTGDMTDAGTRTEWIALAELLTEHADLRGRLLFVPGNHDFNVTDPTNPARLDLPGSAGQALRKLRVVLMLDAVQGGTVHLVNPRTGGVGPSLSDFLRDGRRPALLRDLAEHGSLRGRREMRRIWDAIFPLVAPPRDSGGVGIMLLDSNASRHFALTNAIGVIRRSQLKGMRTALRAYEDNPWLILLHHHLLEYPLLSIGLSERIGLSLVNARDVIKSVASRTARVVVFHGHRHRDWTGTLGQATICSAPSVTMGSYNQDEAHGYFHICELGFADSGQVVLESVDLVSVS